MHNSDVGFERHSPRDARFMRFVSDGPGIAGFRFDVDPEIDGDAAAQFLAGADRARVEEQDLAVDSHRPRELSLEAYEALGVEFADPDSLEAIEICEAYEGGDEGDDGYPDEDGEEDDERPEGVIRLFRDGESSEITPRRERPGNGRLYREMVIQPRLEVMRLVSRMLAAAAKSEPAKGNGNGHRPVPPVGKFLKGVVVDQGLKGLLVDAGGIEIRVPIALERGHGSWEAAARWLHSHTVGTKVRLMVQYVNGHIEAVLTTNHRRPDGWQPPRWACRRSQQTEAPAAN